MAMPTCQVCVARSSRRASGFTLIEMVVTMVILGIIASIGVSMMGGSYRAYVDSRNLTETDWQGRLAVERMTRELRAVGSPATLVIAPAFEITFTDTGGTVIRYCLATINGCPGATAGDLMRNNQPLASGVSGLQFTYLQNDGITLAIDPANVSYITVRFTVTQGSATPTYQATVHPRSFI